MTTTKQERLQNYINSRGIKLKIETTYTARYVYDDGYTACDSWGDLLVTYGHVFAGEAADVLHERILDEIENEGTEFEE